MKKNWALSVDQCSLQALQFSMHLIDLLSILLRYNGFTRIQKAVVDQTGSRPSNSDHDLFLFKCDAGKDRRWEVKGTTEAELVGWHHQLNGHEFKYTPGVGDGQGGLACCSLWGHKESDMAE